MFFLLFFCWTPRPHADFLVHVRSNSFVHTFYLLLFNLYINKFDFDTGAIICLVASLLVGLQKKHSE